ncbi:putative membrane protein [Janthinobacterium sp. HH01]|uniref:MMPL family transporter n=1 Tax=Janthinobacterium sp. HH01 TaxID=1198452 RepID=UPI0002AE9901|nr:membrane protein [Janthinobacterium sp. HH01]ELX09994.1 putative membrane protein [Janthinobacterium sp. HH01]
MTRTRQLALLWAFAVCLLLGHNAYLWLVQRIVPDTDIMALLPVQERDPLLQQSFSHMVDAAQQRVVVLVGAADWEDARRAADAYGAVLAARKDVFEATPINEQTQSDWLSLFQRHRLALLTAPQEAQLRHQPAQFWLETALNKLYSPFGGPNLGSWREDPFGLFAGWVQERAQETPVRPRDGHLFVADAQRQYVLLPLTLKVPALSMTAQDTVLPLLKQAGDAARKATPQVELIQAGVILHAANASAQASGEVSTIGIGSLLGIVLLMWFAFHSFKPISLILLSIGIGCLGALSVCWLLFGRVHLMTLVFGASLIGVAQDYGIYFLCNRLAADEQLASPALLKRLLPGLGLTLLAAVIGYMGLALTPFPGLRQMAVFSALGLVFAWLTVVCWFPALIGGRTLKSGALVRGYGAALLRWPLLRANRTTLLAAVAFALAAGYGINRLGANDDIRLLQNPPKHLIADQLKLSKLLDAPTPVQYFLVRGDSVETVLQREEALKARLDLMAAARRISGYQAMSNWVPSARTQAGRLALIEEKLLADGGPLQAIAAQTGEDAQWIAATAGGLRAAGAPLTLDAFLKTPASEPWRHLWLGETNGVYASIVALRGLSNAAVPQVKQAADGMPGVQWVDKVAEISSVLGRYREYMGWVVLGAYAVVFALLFPRYRRRTWRVLAPTALASIATLALLGFASQNLQLFHVLALMLLLGVGVDYGIFMQEHPDRRDRTPWLAVGMSAANTILSFGLLGLSSTPALQAFGLTMLLGTALVWLIVPCFGSTKESNND